MQINEDQIYKLLGSPVEEDIEIGLELLLSRYKWDQMVAFFSKYGKRVNITVNGRWKWSLDPVKVNWGKIRHKTNRESVITVIGGYYLWRYEDRPPLYTLEDIEFINH